jgi:hypothetical protein
LTYPVIGQTKKKKVSVKTTTVKTAENVPIINSGNVQTLIDSYKFSNAATILQREITTRRKKKLSVEQEEQDLNTAQMGIKMLDATQKIVFIDSIVTSYDNFISNISLSSESGSIQTYNKFFNASKQPNAYVYQNEFGNKCYYSLSDSSGNTKLFTSDKIGGKWSDPMPLNGLEHISDHLNYPFMMTDGTTLYFAATGKESLGGYDIFVTRYDSGADKYLKPENLGMPFNSPANDYMYAEDDMNNIGWFVTDRNQSAGKVCIYIFIPSDTRQAYDKTKLSEQEIIRAAYINRIADTWGNNKDRQKALTRLHNAIKNKNKKSGDNSDTFSFIINDNITYKSVNDFKSDIARQKITDLLDKEKHLTELINNTEEMRDKYTSAGSQQKLALKPQILRAEKETESLQKDIKELEKLIRNTEFKSIK